MCVCMYIYIYIYIYIYAHTKCELMRIGNNLNMFDRLESAGRPGFNPRSSHTKDFKNGTWYHLA